MTLPSLILGKDDSAPLPAAFLAPPTTHHLNFGFLSPVVNPYQGVDLTSLLVTILPYAPSNLQALFWNSLNAQFGQAPSLGIPHGVNPNGATIGPQPSLLLQLLQQGSQGPVSPGSTVAPVTTTKPSKKTRKRGLRTAPSHSFTNSEKDMLTSQFEINPTPSRSEKEFLGRKLNVSSAQIAHWFANRRAMAKKH